MTGSATREHQEGAADHGVCARHLSRPKDGAWELVEEGTPDVFSDYYCAGCGKQPDDDDIVEALDSIPTAVSKDETDDPPRRES